MDIKKQVKKLAKILVDYSVKVKKGEFVQIKFYGYARPLVKELTKLISKKGAFYIVLLNSYSHVKYSPMDNLKKIVPLREEISKKIDCVISIDDKEDLYALKDVDNKRINAVGVAHNDINTYIINSKRWCIVRYPTLAYAKQARISLENYSKYAFKTMNVNWEKEKNKMKKLKEKLEKTNMVRIVGRKTDLSFSIKNRNASICAGEFNMPDGEVFTAPIKESTNGKLFVPIAYYNGKKFENIDLVFKNGKITKFNVKKNKKEFGKIINVDKNAKYFGEFGIGLNKGVKKIVGDILFDEKIGGTIHLALGCAYHENFKENLKRMSKEKVKQLTNNSAIHWDMIIRPIKIYFDNKLQKLL